MFRYYQATAEKTCRWEAAPDSKKFNEELHERKVPMKTVLAVSEVVDGDDIDESKLSYKGPMYFDIDNSDINVSITSTQELVQKLRGLGVQDIHIWLSGSKGFHVLVPAEVFSTGRPAKGLPLVYREIAQSLWVEGLDMVVYSCGRGRMWRQPNIQRSNGKYKVPVTEDELLELNADSYDRLVSFPRELPQPVTGVASAALSVLFETSKQKVQRYLRAMETAEFVSSEELEKITDDAGCIQKLITVGDKEGSNFNQAAMQLSAYIQAKYDRSEQEKWMPLVRTLASNVESTTYKTEGARVKHIRGAVFRAYADKRFGFSKGALFSVITPCGACDICQGLDEQGKEPAEMQIGILKTELGYYLEGEKTDKQLTTFTIDPVNFFTAQHDDGSRVRSGIEAYVHWQGDKTRIQIQDYAWESRKNFVQAFTGIGDLAIFANDIEIQKIKHFLFSQELATMGEIHTVSSCGIHWMQIGSVKTLVYVEPTMSITSAYEQGTHIIDRDLPAPPKIFQTPHPDPKNPELLETLRKLTKINDPHIVAQVLGWTAACHIKQQIITKINQFPLINLWGSASSGKTKTGNLMCFLHGIDYEMEAEVLDLENTTAYSIVDVVGSSTTCPRIIEEANPSVVQPRVYNKFLGVAKAAWGGLADTKGTLSNKAGRAAETVSVKLTGPVMYMTEQPPERPALRLRSVQVGFSERQRSAPGRQEAFEYAFERRHLLTQVAKELVTESLQTLPKWCHDRMAHHAETVPREVDVRAHYSYTVVLAGLDFLEKTLTSIGLDLSTELDGLRTALTDYLCGNRMAIGREKRRSESDIVLEQLATLAAQPSSEQIRLIPNVHYVRDGDRLALDPILAFPQYGRWCRSLGTRPPVTNAQAFTALLQGESYYVGLVPHPEKPECTFVQLDIEKLRDKGIPVSHFVYDLE